jgi:RNA polymerase sigma factor (sigma-70 family)
MLAALYRAHVEAVERMLRGGFTFTSGGKTIRFRGFERPFALQEALQDGFMHAFRASARERYDESRSFRPYLMTIVRNHVIDRFRREALEGRLFVAVSAVGGEGESEQETLDRVSAEVRRDADPEVSALQGELTEALSEFVEELDEIEGAILERHLLGDLSQRAVADELDISRNDVRKHIRQMRARLLRYLKSRGFIDSLAQAEAIESVAALGAITAVVLLTVR